MVGRLHLQFVLKRRYLILEVKELVLQAVNDTVVLSLSNFSHVARIARVPLVLLKFDRGDWRCLVMLLWHLNFSVDFCTACVFIGFEFLLLVNIREGGVSLVQLVVRVAKQFISLRLRIRAILIITVAVSLVLFLYSLLLLKPSQLSSEIVHFFDPLLVDLETALFPIF